MDREPHFYVYVFELNDDPKYVYIGQSFHPPEIRWIQHKQGIRTAPSIKHCKIGKLRPELYEMLNPIMTQEESLKKEAWLADTLTGLGYKVEGGH